MTKIIIVSIIYVKRVFRGDCASDRIFFTRSLNYALSSGYFVTIISRSACKLRTKNGVSKSIGIQNAVEGDIAVFAVARGC